MKTKPWIALGLALSVAGVCRAGLEFSGYIRGENEFKFVIKETADRTSSDWLVLGQAFKGYTLVAFDQKKEVLSVKNGDAIVELPLQGAHVTAAKADSPDVAAQLAAAKAELERLRIHYKDQHPTVVKQLRLIADLEAKSTK